MTIQHWLLLSLITLAGAYMARGIFRSACGSGCGACKSKECPARKLEAIRAAMEETKS